MSSERKNMFGGPWNMFNEPSCIFPWPRERIIWRIKDVLCKRAWLMGHHITSPWRLGRETPTRGPDAMACFATQRKQTSMRCRLRLEIQRRLPVIGCRSVVRYGGKSSLIKNPHNARWLIEHVSWNTEHVLWLIWHVLWTTNKSVSPWTCSITHRTQSNVFYGPQSVF